MGKPAQTGWWWRTRQVFKWCRVVLLLVVLGLVALVIHLTQVGLSGPVKTRLLNELRAQGLDLEFSRLRLRWNGGVAAEGVSLARPGFPDGPSVRVDEVLLKLDSDALKQFKFRVDSLVVRQGRAIWPLEAPGEPRRDFALSNLVAQLRLMPGDRWELDQFEAECLGLKINLNVSLTNASAWRRRPDTTVTTTGLDVWQGHLLRLARLAEKARFPEPPLLTILAEGDARDPASFSARMNLHFPRARLPGITLSNTLFSAQWLPGPGVTPRAKAHLSVDGLSGRQGRLGSLQADLQLLTVGTNLLPDEAEFTVSLAQAGMTNGSLTAARLSGRTRRVTPGAMELQTGLDLQLGGLQFGPVTITNTSLTAGFRHAITNLIPDRVDWKWSADQPITEWGRAEYLKLEGTINRHPASSPRVANRDWGWWDVFEPYSADLRLDLGRVASPKLNLERLTLAAQWQPPLLSLPVFNARLHGGELVAAAELDVLTRVASANLKSDFNILGVTNLLGPKSQHWIQQFSWETPPVATGKARVTLPPWNNRPDGWQNELLSSLSLAGTFSGTNGAFRGISVSTAQSDYGLTNQTWYLPNLHVTRPEGEATLGYEGSMITHEYHWRIDSGLDLRAVEPVLEEAQRKVFEHVQFSTPPRIKGDVWGTWFAREKTGFAADVAASNFVARGEPVASFSGSLSYTNLSLLLTNAHIVRVPGEVFAAPLIGFDVEALRIYVTNGSSTMDPNHFTAAIGKKTFDVVQPYQFARPPQVAVNGSLVIRPGRQPLADLHFDIAGEDFSYWKFHVPRVSGKLHWLGESMTISNVVADFYKGKLNADFAFDFTPPTSADFSFQARAQGANFKLLMADLVTSTNRLAGTLDATLNVTSANSGDWDSWNGNGAAALSEGFLWDIPLFGLFTPVFNAVAPGLGNSPMHAAAATYRIKNSIINTDDMEIRSAALRLQYRGTVDFQARVNARAEAEVLRDMWVVGRLVSFMFMPLAKLFEFKVTGTLNAPQSEPLYTLPKVLLSPLHPIKTLKNLFPGDGKSAESKPPAKELEKPEKP